MTVLVESLDPLVLFVIWYSVAFLEDFVWMICYFFWSFFLNITFNLGGVT